METRQPAYQLQLRQRVTMIKNRWHVERVEPGGAVTELAFAQQKRFSLREQVTFTTADESGVAFTIQARTVLELTGVYDVRDAMGQTLATISKEFRRSLTRSTYGLEVDGRAYVVEERGKVRALLRRAVMLVTSLTDFDFLFWPLPIQFDVRGGEGDLVATVERRPFRVRDLYELKAYDEALDWRVLAAQGVACDAFMNR